MLSNDHTTQSNPQIQYNPYEIINGIFHRTRTTTKKDYFVWKHKRSWDSQNNLEEEQSWMNHSPLISATVTKQYDTGTKADTSIRGTKPRDQKQIHTLMVN